jgi:Outer membrane protein beta-barrel domain
MSIRENPISNKDANGTKNRSIKHSRRKNMNSTKSALILTMAIVLIFSAAASAEEKDYLPTEGGLHLDIRALTVFDGSVVGLEREDDPKDTEAITSVDHGLGSGVGIKLGYLINGHHDVGGHLGYSNTTTLMVLDPEDENLDEIETVLDTSNFRIAGYYNYNWHCKGWVMPYVGPVVGFQATHTQFEDLDDSDSEVSTTLVNPFMGIEGGVKLFVMKNVAFDIAGTTTWGPAIRTTSFGDDRDDDDWAGGGLDLAAHAGVSIYF